VPRATTSDLFEQSTQPGANAIKWEQIKQRQCRLIQAPEIGHEPTEARHVSELAEPLWGGDCHGQEKLGWQ